MSDGHMDVPDQDRFSFLCSGQYLQSEGANESQSGCTSAFDGSELGNHTKLQTLFFNCYMPCELFILPNWTSPLPVLWVPGVCVCVFF